MQSEKQESQEVLRDTLVSYNERLGCSFLDFAYIGLVCILLQLNKKSHMDSVDMLGMSGI